MNIYTSVASTSAGGELKTCEVLLFGNSRKSTSGFRIGHGMLQDAIDADGVRSALRNAGLPSTAIRLPNRRRISPVFAKAEASPTGRSAGGATPCCRTDINYEGMRGPRSARSLPRSRAIRRSSYPAARSTSAVRRDADRGDRPHMSSAAPPHLWQFSATELFKAYERGETTPKEVLEATLERLKQVNSRLNAVVTLDADGARVAAIASTKRWRAKQTRGPIDGVPITIKDSLFVGGLRDDLGQPNLCRLRAAAG